MRTEPFAIAYSNKRVRASVGSARKTAVIEAIKGALVEAGWTVEESLDAYAEFIVWFPFYFITTPADPPIPDENKPLLTASRYGAFGFYNPGVMPLKRVSFYDPYREIPVVEAGVTWVAMTATQEAAMAALLSAFQTAFTGYGTVTMTGTSPYTFRFTVPNAGTAWNDAFMYTKPAFATTVFHGYGLWASDGDMNDGAWKYGGYRLRSAVGTRTGRCQVKIFEPNGGVYPWTGIRIVPGTDAGGFYESSYFVFDFNASMDIIANPHGFVLFSPSNVAGRLNFLFGTPYVPETPYWPETAANHVYAATGYPLDDGQFRLSARPYTLVSYDGGALQYGDFGFVGPTYEVDAPLVYRRGRKPLISNAIGFMGTDRYNTETSKIVGKLWDALVISTRESFPSEFRFDGKLWVEITSQRGLSGTECAVYVAYADANAS